MAQNVRGFRDLNNQINDRQNNYRNVNNPNLNDSIPFNLNMTGDRAPLDETIPYTLRLICCPSLKLISLSTVLSVIMCALYIFCCTQGIDANDKDKNILQIDIEVLIRYGAMQDLLLKDGEVYRLITSSFVHWNLLHISTNLISFVFFLSRLEKTYSMPLMAALILVSSISGNIFSALCNQKGTVSAGASGVVFGILGAYLAFMTINWSALSAYREMRSQMCCIIGILVFFSLLFSLGRDVDIYGHIGGLVGGYFFSLAILPGMQSKDKKQLIIGIFGCVAFNLVSFIVFFAQQ